MNLQKHEREALFAVRRMCQGIVADLRPAGKHPQLIALYAGKHIRVSVSCSPSCSDLVAFWTVQQVRRRFKAIGVDLPLQLEEPRRVRDRTICRAGE